MAYDKKKESIEAAPDPWVEKQKRCDKMVNDYISQFKKSMLWLEAVRDGWDLHLFRYLYSAASLQSQLINGLNAGFDKTSVFGAGSIDDEDIYHWKNRQRSQAEMGFIDISVPTGIIEEWKRCVSTQ